MDRPTDRGVVEEIGVETVVGVCRDGSQERK
jgi:hypothetical protein